MSKKLTFTARGDDGKTNLVGQGRFSKADLRFDVLGTLDECSAVIGLAKSMILDQDIKDILTRVQRDLYHIMGEVSVVSEQKEVYPPLSDTSITWLEEMIELLSPEASAPGGFIVPGDTREDAVLDVTRTIIRRAERRLVELIENEGFVSPVSRQYLNRLSSLIFTMELVIHKRLNSLPPTMAKVP